MLLEFAIWLSKTGLSRFIQQELWVIPMLQSIHILAVAALFSSTLFINLRLIGKADVGHTLVTTTGRFMPWVWAGFVVLALTGVLLVAGEPRRELTSAPFWIKMGLIVLAFVATLWFSWTVAQDADRWDRPEENFRARLYAFGTLTVWIGVITAGRLIAYVY
jgi:hypothetical protein